MEKETTWETENKTQEKEMMHNNTIAHQPCQPILSCHLWLLANSPPVYVLGMIFYGWKIALGTLGHLSQPCSFPASCAPAHWQGMGHQKVLDLG